MSETPFFQRNQNNSVHELIFIGIKFWKVGSRKLFAVNGHGHGSKRRESDYDSDSETSTNPTVVGMLTLISSKVHKILEVSPNLPMPLGVMTVIKESFKCHICLTHIVPPPIFGRCCRRLIGCQSCVNEWYRGEAGITKQCPLCRGERGLADTTPILGLDEFFAMSKQLLGPPPTPNVPPPPVGPLHLPDID